MTHVSRLEPESVVDCGDDALAVARRAFNTYFGMKVHCDQCGLRFEREEGYWVGALIINTTVTFGSFLGHVRGRNPHHLARRALDRSWGSSPSLPTE